MTLVMVKVAVKALSGYSEIPSSIVMVTVRALEPPLVIAPAL